MPKPQFKMIDTGNHTYYEAGASSPVVMAARSLWCNAHEDGRPLRDAINLLDAPEIFPHLIEVDVHANRAEAPHAFYIRFLGTFVSDLSGRNNQGKWMDEELYGDAIESVTWTFRTCALTEEPLLTNGLIDFAENDWSTIETIFLPVFNSADELTQILCILDTVPRRHEFDLEAGDAILNWKS